MQIEQNQNWQKLNQAIDVSDILENYQKPAPFQRELALILDKICSQNNYRKILEAGCGSGITSTLLNDDLDKTFLDIDEGIIQKVKIACTQIGKKGNFVTGDIFSLSFPDKTFDLVFNSGVIEHFSYKDRVSILKEFRRVLKDNGTIVIGFPNHYSFPYRSAYVFKKIILRGWHWPYPEEYKLYDLKSEIKEADLKFFNRLCISKATIFNWWNFFKPLKKFLVYIDKFFKWEGYLTVIVIKK